MGNMWKGCSLPAFVLRTRSSKFPKVPSLAVSWYMRGNNMYVGI